MPPATANNSMPFVETEDLRVHYALTGTVRAPVLILSNSLGTTYSMWDLQLPALERKFRVLRYNTRGQGQTAVTPSPYTIEQLGRDVAHLMDELELEQAHFCGLSMSGMIGMWLALNAPARLQKLVLCNTAAQIGTAQGWNARIESVRQGGMKAVAQGVIDRWLTPEFRARSPQVAAMALRMLESSPPKGYIGCCAAVRDCDYRNGIAAIRVPTFVIAGSKDPATPPEDSRFLADHIPGAQYVELNSSHLSNLEAPEEFTNQLIEFLSA
jgi:3-oxoadipate enol-lactonase